MYEGLALISQVGLNVLIPIVLFILIGSWIDNKFDTGNWALLICTILGAAAGIMNIIKLGKKL